MDTQEKRELRELGWTLWRDRAKRPQAVRRSQRIPVEEANDAALVELDGAV